MVTSRVIGARVKAVRWPVKSTHRRSQNMSFAQALCVNAGGSCAFSIVRLYSFSILFSSFPANSLLFPCFIAASWQHSQDCGFWRDGFQPATAAIAWHLYSEIALRREKLLAHLGKSAVGGVKCDAFLKGVKNMSFKGVRTTVQAKFSAFSSGFHRGGFRNSSGFLRLLFVLSSSFLRLLLLIHGLFMASSFVFPSGGVDPKFHYDISKAISLNRHKLLMNFKDYASPGVRFVQHWINSDRIQTNRSINAIWVPICKYVGE